LIPKKATINALVSIVLDPATKDSEFIQVLYHKDQVGSALVPGDHWLTA
jgi:hypothetical protein